MRAALLIVLGLAIGIFGTIPVMNSLSERNPLPKAVMVTMGYHMHEVQSALKGGHCDAAANLDQLQHMQMTAADITAAFPGAPKPFLDDAAHLRAALQSAAQAAPADCKSLTEVIRPAGKVCQDCHRQYR